MKDFKSFIYEYRGAIIGGIIALIVLFTGLLKLVLGLVILAMRNIFRQLYTTK